jgi:hypothetical protein
MEHLRFLKQDGLMCFLSEVAVVAVAEPFLPTQTTVEQVVVQEEFNHSLFTWHQVHTLLTLVLVVLVVHQHLREPAVRLRQL